MSTTMNKLSTNEILPLNKKIFSMRVLSNIMIEEREKKYKKIEELNEIMYLNISVEEKVKKLIDTANRNGGFDNIGVSLMEVKQC